MGGSKFTGFPILPNSLRDDALISGAGVEAEKAKSDDEEPMDIRVGQKSVPRPSRADAYYTLVASATSVRPRPVCSDPPPSRPRPRASTSTLLQRNKPTMLEVLMETYSPIVGTLVGTAFAPQQREYAMRLQRLYDEDALAEAGAVELWQVAMMGIFYSLQLTDSSRRFGLHAAGDREDGDAQHGGHQHSAVLRFLRTSPAWATLVHRVRAAQSALPDKLGDLDAFVCACPDVVPPSDGDHAGDGDGDDNDDLRCCLWMWNAPNAPLLPLLLALWHPSQRRLVLETAAAEYKYKFGAAAKHASVRRVPAVPDLPDDVGSLVVLGVCWRVLMQGSAVVLPNFDAMLRSNHAWTRFERALLSVAPSASACDLPAAATAAAATAAAATAAAATATAAAPSRSQHQPPFGPRHDADSDTGAATANAAENAAVARTAVARTAANAAVARTAVAQTVAVVGSTRPHKDRHHNKERSDIINDKLTKADRNRFDDDDNNSDGSGMESDDVRIVRENRPTSMMKAPAGSGSKRGRETHAAVTMASPGAGAMSAAVEHEDEEDEDEKGSLPGRGRGNDDDGDGDDDDDDDTPQQPPEKRMRPASSTISKRLDNAIASMKRLAKEEGVNKGVHRQARELKTKMNDIREERGVGKRGRWAFEHERAATECLEQVQRLMQQASQARRGYPETAPTLQS